jgi:hypothetical protein
MNSKLFQRLSAIPGRAWIVLAGVAWVGALGGLVARAFLSPERATNTARYLRAGEAWLDGGDLYRHAANKGFVYSPLAAICYAATTPLPTPLANSFWILVSGILLLGGLWAMMHGGPFAHLTPGLQGLVLLLVFPLALGNLDSAQANPLVIGFVMLAVAAASKGQWTIAAVAVGGATFWKVYPLAVGLLLVLVAPWRFSWRLLLVLLAGALLPFLFQSHDYVAGQYALWWDTRTGDNRLAYAIGIAPLDLWFLLVRVGGLPLGDGLYRVVQLVGGAGVAAFVLFGRVRGWPPARLLGGMFGLVCVWMTLLGPASEIHAYLLLAPAAALAVAGMLSCRADAFSRALAFAAYACLLLAILRVAFVPHVRLPVLLAIQPAGAILFLGHAIKYYLTDSFWTAEGPAPK